MSSAPSRRGDVASARRSACSRSSRPVTGRPPRSIGAPTCRSWGASCSANRPRQSSTCCTTTERGSSGGMSTMAYETILYEVGDRIATITFNRPERLNAISLLMTQELNDAYGRAEGDDDVWTIIVRANGRAFCSGADVEEVPADGKVPHEGEYLSHFHEWEAPQEATPPFRTMAKPIVVAVNGICCGAGMDLVTTGDISIAGEDATFFDPHVSIGLVSGREMVRVARALPINVAMRMALLGKHERLTAQRAYELGFVTEVV